MNQREAEPADVRPFLPRPGEPVEEYAERLRAMHRDLSVVLQAVERGLQRANPPEEEPETEAEREPVAVHAAGPLPRPPAEARVASAAREPSGAALRETMPGAPRVEIVTSRPGHRAGDETVTSAWAQPEPFVERRQAVVPPPLAEPLPDDPSAPAEPPSPLHGRRSTDAPSAEPSPPPGRRSSDPLRIVPTPPPRPALAERPSADPRYAEASPGAWAPAVVTELPADPAAAPPPAVPAPATPAVRPPLLPPWAVAAILAGWLTIVALLLALLLDG